MSKKQIKYLYYFFIFIIALLVVIIPRGSSSEDTTLKFNETGRPVLALEGEGGGGGKLNRLPVLYGQSLQKDDYGFVTFYTYRISFDLSSVNEVNRNKLFMTVDVPGAITTIEGGSLSEGKAVFELSLGEKRNFVVSSRDIHWTWIALVVFAIISTAVFFFWRRQVEKLQPKNRL